MSGFITLAETGSGSLSVLSEAVEFVLGIFTNMSSTLLTMPLFLIGVAIFAVGAGIGLVKRIL